MSDGQPHPTDATAPVPTPAAHTPPLSPARGTGDVRAQTLDDHLSKDFGFDSDEWQSRARRASRPGEVLGSLGQYELTLELGRGAQGVVYKAVQPGTGRVVALKRLGAGIAPSERDIEHLRREVRAATRLSHPNIVTVYATETVGTHAVLVMEYVAGLPIDRWADERRAKGGELIPSLLQCFLGVCDGVEHAHRRGVIHRDIKPSNVLVAADGVPKILDFGIALLVDHLRLPTTMTGFVGTPAYAAPEQVLGTREREDTRCDVYALGAVLRRMLTGEELFEPGASLAQIVDVARSGTRTPASRTHPDIPKDLDWIILKAMAPEPDDRYQSVNALAEDVRLFLSGRAVSAHPPTLRYQAGRFIARHRLACALAGVAIAAVIILSAVSTVQAIRLGTRGKELATALDAERIATAEATTARDQAEEQRRIASEERDRQQAIATYLLNIADGVAENSTGRSTIPVGDLADWFEGAEGALDAVDDPVVQARLHLGLCVMRRVSGDSDSARLHAQRALDLLPERGHERLRLLALIRLCSVTSSQVPDGERAVAYMQAAGLADEYVAIEAWRQLATCYSRAGRADDALAALGKATEVAARAGVAADEQAAILADEAAALLRARRFDDVLARGQLAIGSVPADLVPTSEACRRASVLMGEAAYRKGDVALAEEHLARASRWAQQFPGDGHIGTRNAMRWHARSLQELGRFDEAAVLYERLLQLVPPGQETTDLGVWAVRYRYAATLLGQGRTQEARRQLCLAVSKGKQADVEPDDPLSQQVDTAHAALMETKLHFTPALRRALDDLSWLVDFTTGVARSGQEAVPGVEPPTGG